MSLLPSVSNRLAARNHDLQVVQRAGVAIADLGLTLDSLLRTEQRPSERMRMLRETTNRITRTANDAIQAYRRVSRALSAEVERADGDVPAADQMRIRLEEARKQVLDALDEANRRYPWKAEDEGSAQEA